MRSIPFLVPLVVYLAALALMRPFPAGDEPSYALEARSLARDGDRDLGNQYDSPVDVRWASRSASTVPHAFTYGASTALVNVHGPGLPVLLAPAAATFASLTALRVVAVLIAALAAWQLFGLLAQITALAPRWRWAAWAATVFSLPWVSYSTQLYPELAAVLMMLVALRCVIRATPAALIGGGAAAAVLPWLHVRFAIVAVMLIAALVVRAAQVHRRRALVVSLVLALPVLSFALLAGAFAHWYGSPSLASPYDVPGFAATTRPAIGLLYVNGLGAILSLGHGWLPYAPVAVIGVAGAVYAGRGSGRWGLALGFGAVVYCVMIGIAHDLPSFNFPARFALPLVALSALPLAISLTRLRSARRVFWPLAVLSCAITFFGVTRPGMLYPHGQTAGTHEIPLVFTSIWPRLASKMPTVTRDLSAADLVSGTSLTLPAAEYRLAVQLRGPLASDSADVTVRSGRHVLGENEIPAFALPSDATPRTFYVDVRLPRAGPVRVTTAGSDGRVLAGTLASLPNSLPGSDRPQRLDIVRTTVWVLAFLGCWIAGLAVTSGAGGRLLRR